MTGFVKAIALTAALTAGTGSVFAQAASQPPATPPATPGSPQTIPEKTPSSPAATTGSGTLTDKLDKSNGVIKPATDVDPGMAKSAPATQQTMPVIKPLEEKGGPTAK